MRTSPRFVSAVVTSFVATALLLSACRKAPPDENVYTGATVNPGVGGTSSGGSGGSPPSGGSGGVAGSAGVAGAGGETFDGIAGPAPDVPFTKANFLAQIADCAVAHYENFSAKAEAFDQAATSNTATRSSDSLVLARKAFSDAMAAWQQAELFRFGPAAQSTEPGGKDYRDNIYAWPLFGRCKIEEQLVSQVYASPNFVSSLINGRGLGAAEYALYYTGDDNACSQFSSINANGTWAALGPGELQARKADYAAAVAKDVRARATDLIAEWSPSGGNFRQVFVTAGSGSSLFVTDQKALNAVSDALFYVEKEVKDLKLAKPVGVLDCFTPTCPEAVESPYSGQSIPHMRQNLRAFARLYHGCYAGGEGLGFDDWLRGVGATDIADDMSAALAAAQAALGNEDQPLEQIITQDLPRAVALHTAVKKLTDSLKTEFVTVLNLDLPKTVQGDND